MLAAAVAPAWAGDPANLMFPMPAGGGAGWTVVPFSANGAQGSGPAAPADPLQRNDDDFAQAGTGMPAVPFTFTLYGAPFTGTTIFLNNNGNLSFGAGFSTFTSTGFPVATFPMVAPFWADVDTRNTVVPSGVAWYQYFDTGAPGVDTLVMTWDNVGYFASQADKLNTFQVAISDGTNPAMGIGNNVCFSYDDMQWTTGSASGGVAGFGGTPATVGVNAGDGSGNFFQIGRFDHAGVDYNGPGNPPGTPASGVSFLDGLDTCFNASGAVNAPPFSPDMPPKVTFTIGVPNHRSYSFIGPEAAQSVLITSATCVGPGPGGPTIALGPNPGNPAGASIDWTPTAANMGKWVCTFVYEDNFSPPAVTTQTLSINVVPEPASALLLLGGLLALRRRR
jgi:hypothetical protein